MLVTEATAAIIAWSIAGMIVIASAAAGITLLRRDSRLGVPVIAIGLLAALFLSATSLAHGTRVLVVFDEGGVFARKDLRVYGGATYRFADGTPVQLRWNSARQLVLNDTSVPLTIEKVMYGVHFGDRLETPLGAFQMVELDGRIDHFGPQDQPPGTSEKWERYWLR